MQPPAGPVYLPVPLDDWKQALAGPARVRRVSTRVAPEAKRLRLFANRISASHRPALVFGPEVDRASFPEDHPLFRGPLGMSVKAISDRLAGHDLAVVIGAAVFRYYPYVPGEHLPEGTELLQITADPGAAAAARVATACSATPRSRSTCSWSRSRRAPAGRPHSRWRGHACSPRWQAAR